MTFFVKREIEEADGLGFQSANMAGRAGFFTPDKTFQPADFRGVEIERALLQKLFLHLVGKLGGDLSVVLFDFQNEVYSPDGLRIGDRQITEKWWLSQLSKRKMEDLEDIVAKRTRDLCRANEDLQTEIVEHKRTGNELRGKTAFLEAQVHSSIDGMLVVYGNGKKILQNQRMIDLWKIPQPIADEANDETGSNGA